MIQEICPVETVEQVAENIHVLTFASRSIARSVVAGQFVNIRIDEGTEPLLRRPFSVYNTLEGNQAQIVFNVVGKGTSLLAQKKSGDTIDVLGPLGFPFSFNGHSFDTAILVGGGLGVAPLPLTSRELRRLGKRVISCLGARSASMLVEQHLENVHVATDDGSKGHHGNVVELVKQVLSGWSFNRVKMFACGPTVMLRALQAYVVQNDILCEASLEGPMGCGFGICQGCPVELMGTEKKYALMCKDGPAFDLRTIRI